jgi:hypothetical protein
VVLWFPTLVATARRHRVSASGPTAGYLLRAPPRHWSQMPPPSSGGSDGGGSDGGGSDDGGGGGTVAVGTGHHGGRHR